MKIAQSCPTLGDPKDYTVHGILQARILEWVVFPFSRGSSQTQGSNPGLLHCGRILYPLSHQGNPWWEHCNSPLTATFNHSEQYCQLQSLWPLDLQTLIILELKVCSFWLTYVRLTHPPAPAAAVLLSPWTRCFSFLMSEVLLHLFFSVWHFT